MVDVIVVDDNTDLLDIMTEVLSVKHRVSSSSDAKGFYRLFKNIQ